MGIIQDFFNQFTKKKEEIPTSKENIETSQDFLNALVSGKLNGFASKFVTDIYKEKTLYPHEEMAIAKKAYLYNAYVNSSVRTRANFTTGGKIKVVSADPNTEKKLNALLEQTKLSEYAQFLGIDLVDVGNFYVERIRANGKIVNYQYISHPENMYINIDKAGLVQDYFQELPETWAGANFETIKYYGDKRKSIKGKKIPKDKIFHIKLGVSEIPVYGRGFVACVVNDVKILLEIERAIAVISRYKAIPKKLLYLNRGEDPSGGKAAEWYANQLNNLSDEEIAVTPEEIGAIDLSYSGKDINFEPIVQYLKKKITVALAPSFIMHGEETNYAVSRDQKEAFILQINAERESVAQQLKKEIMLLAKSHGITPKEFEVKFGDFDLGQSEQKLQYSQGAFTSNMVTLNEAREYLGLPEDKELGGMYYNEMTANAGLFGLGSNGEEEQTGEETSPDSEDTEKT